MSSNISFDLSEIASKFNLECIGSSDIKITSFAPLASAQPGQLSFLDNSKYKKYLQTTKASAVILAKKDLPFCPIPALVSPNPYLSYAQIVKLFYPTDVKKQGIHPTAIIPDTAEVHPTASIGPYVVIGENTKIAEHAIIGAHCAIGNHCSIGAYTELKARVTLYDGVKIGERGLFHSGVVIGSDGFGFAPSTDGWYKVPQVGSVVIENDVEIGANTTIDRGALEATIIKDGVKLDNQIQVGHNVQIGKNTIIAGCTGIAGSTIIGDSCMIAGGVGIAGHLEIANQVVVTAMTGISKSLREPGIYASGIQADKHESWRRNTIHFHHLADYAKRLQRLEDLITSEED